MKKFKSILKGLLLGSIVFTGCSCSKEEIDTYANVSNQNEILTISRGDNLTVGEVYDYIRKQNQNEISENLLKMIMKKELDFSKKETKDLYNELLKEELKTRFIDSGSYDYDGEFDETLLIKYLKSESYDIDESTCSSNSSLLEGTDFTCDYSDYIEKELDYDIYLKMLKIKYIVGEKSGLIDKSLARKISYYSVSRSSSTDYTTREELEKDVESIEANKNSSAEDAIKSIKDIADKQKQKDLNEIDEQFKKVSVNEGNDDSTFVYLNKFTTCGNKKCTLEDGKIYQDSLILEKDYYTTEIVTKNDTDILYEGARNLLFSSNVEDYLYKIGDVNYLVSPAYGNAKDNDVKDIILFDNSSTYYIVSVDVIDSSSQDLTAKAQVAELLIDKVTDADVLSYYFEKSEIKIYDKQIREYFISKYGEY